MSKETVLVTGGAGFIGSHIVDALLVAGYHVRVLDNLEPQVHGGLRENGKKPDYLNPEAEFILGDIRDPDCVAKALKGVDVVFHEAALVGVGQSMYEISRYTDVNANGTATLLQTMVNAKDRPRKMMVASSMSIYGEGPYECPVHGTVFPKLRPVEQLESRDWELRCPSQVENSPRKCNLPLQPIPTFEDKPLFPTSIYAINKRDHEEMFLAIGFAYKIPTVALRYFNVYGTRQALNNPYTGVAAIFSNRLLNGKPPVIFEDGFQTRDFVHVSDIVQANLLVMQCDEADYGVFNVGTGRRLSILDVSNALISHFAQSQDRNHPYGSFVPEIVNKFRSGDIRHCFADINRIRSLGYQPKVAFEDGVAELIGWVRSQTVSDSFDKARQELLHRGLAL